MPERSKDWINQANRGLHTAQGLLDQGSFEWSCFVARQAAVKAVIQKLNAVAWGHSVHELLSILVKRVEVDKGVLDFARALDKYYIPTRYPNSFDSGSPYQYFTKEDADNAIICSRRIARFCEGILA
jgi:HEPN domain-containing protein